MLETNMVALWLEGKGMATTITLKNVPDELYERLKAAAKAHHRSINSEAILCLESALAPRKRMSPNERIERIQAINAGMQTKWFDHDLIDELKNEGRA
jgi:plasmid stability protein